MVVFTGTSMSYQDYFNIKSSDSDAIKALKFAIGLAPKPTQLSYMDATKINFDAGKGPSCAISVTQCASMVCGNIAKLLIGRGAVKETPHFAQFDLYRNLYRKGRLLRGNRGLFQKFKIWYVGKYILGKAKQKNVNPPVPFKNSDMNDSELKQIIHFMMRAPTGDNCQHWNFEFADGVLSIFYDEPRGAHALNSNLHSAKVGFGALLASARIAASHLGLKSVEKILLTDTNTEGAWAELRFERDSSVVTNPLYGTLEQRASDRRAYNGGTVNHWVFDKISQNARQYPRCKITFLSSFSEDLLAYFAKSETFVWKTEPARKDLHQWLRWTKAAAIKTRDGLPWQSLGISFPEALTLWILKPKALQKLANKFIFLRLAQMTMRKNVKSSAALGLITVKEKSTEALIEAGGLLLDAWLNLNSANFGLCMHSAATLPVYDKATGNLTEHAAKEFHVFFESGIRDLQKWFDVDDADTPLLSFRTGIASPLPKGAKTLRRDVDQVLRIVSDN